MLTRNSYLESQKKNPDIRSQPNPPGPTPPPGPGPGPTSHNPIPGTHTQPQPQHEPARHRAASDAHQMQARMRTYQREMRALQQTNQRQQQAARKMLSFQQANRQYHQAMRLKNLELNSKLKNAVCEVQVGQHRKEEEINRYAHEKDAILHRFEEQGQEMMRLRNTLSSMIEQKAALEEQLNAVTFALEKERHQAQLQIRELAFKMEGIDRTYRGVVAGKDEEIGQLLGRLRLYEDENKKLNDINKTLQLTKDKVDKIDNLSHINYPQSNIKQKENEDPRSNIKDNNELKQQKVINEQLKRQLDKIKKRLEQLNQRNSQLESQPTYRPNDSLLETSQWLGMINSVATLREGINKQVFQVFFKSVKEGERTRHNSLVLFIENWKCLEMQHLLPYIRSYFQARSNLKDIASTPQAQESVHYDKMLEVIPLKVGGKAGRSNINQWILSTIQFTKNQKEAAKKGLNNYLLFLFRLLTIEYRVKYPMKGKSYSLDADVTNQLKHEIVKAIELISKYSS